jgi:hypothetical protein
MEQRKKLAIKDVNSESVFGAFNFPLINKEETRQQVF